MGANLLDPLDSSKASLLGVTRGWEAEHLSASDGDTSLSVFARLQLANETEEQTEGKGKEGWLWKGPKE